MNGLHNGIRVNRTQIDKLSLSSRWQMFDALQNKLTRWGCWSTKMTRTLSYLFSLLYPDKNYRKRGRQAERYWLNVRRVRGSTTHIHRRLLGCLKRVNERANSSLLLLQCVSDMRPTFLSEKNWPYKRDFEKRSHILYTKWLQKV